MGRINSITTKGCGIGVSLPAGGGGYDIGSIYNENDQIGTLVRDPGEALRYLGLPLSTPPALATEALFQMSMLRQATPAQRVQQIENGRLYQWLNQNLGMAANAATLASALYAAATSPVMNLLVAKLAG